MPRSVAPLNHKAHPANRRPSAIPEGGTKRQVQLRPVELCALRCLSGIR